MSETTQPDPQIVAWMRGHLREHPGTAKVRLISAWLAAHGYDSFAASGRTLPELTVAANAACSPQPLTVADIPAGQGAASLFIASADASGHLALWFQGAGGPQYFIRWAAAPGDTPADRALWEHLAATLRTVDTTEEST